MSSIAERLRSLKKANYRETEPLTFPDGTQVILSTLTAKEDRALSDYLLAYMDKATGYYAKIETLCHAIKWVQPAEGEAVDLRNVEAVETGDTTDSGVAVRQPKHVFIRPIVETWNDVLVDTLYMRFARLVADTEEDVARGIKVEMSNEVLLSKIDTKAEELEALVRRAQSLGLSPKTAFDFTDKAMEDAGADRLLKALQQTKAKPEAPTAERVRAAATEPKKPSPPPPPPEDEEVEETPTRIRS
jgi:hypothetical protein